MLMSMENQTRTMRLVSRLLHHWSCSCQSFLQMLKTSFWGNKKSHTRLKSLHLFHPHANQKQHFLDSAKGGTILNQLITEFSFSEIQSTEFPPQSFKNAFNGGVDNWIIPTSKELLFNSIAEIHDVDVGLNTEGTYLTDKDVIDRISELLTRRVSGIRFLFHGTPRQMVRRQTNLDS